jgi:alditol oxidase
MIEQQSNWARNLTYTAATLHQPETVEQVQSIVSRSARVKALGSRHSFNHIADSSGDLISLDRFQRVLTVDHDRHTATVDAGARYGHICALLHREGYALPNLASLPHISVAGACATATHGSGERNGNLATVVSSIELVTADGSLVQLSREKDGDRFLGAVVGLGALGVVTRLTLDLIPAYDMRQDVYENLPWPQLEAHLDEIVGAADSVSLLTDWQSDFVNLAWLKRRIVEGATFEPEPRFFGAAPATAHRHPIVSIVSAEACTDQLGIPGPWYERLPHFRMDFTPSSGEELQSEYMVPRHYAMEALRAVASLRARIAPLLQITEVRTIAADNLWMSPCYHQPCVSIHFTWRKDWQAVSQLLPVIEARLAPFEARPHWGKLFTMQPAQLQPLYPRLADFRQLALELDPTGKFRNPFLDTYIFT